jgi:transcriptional regulator GlxA family with amidase domain
MALAFSPLSRSIVPTAATPLRIAIVLNGHSSVALAFLLRTVFARANRLLGGERYAVAFVSAGGSASLELQGATVAAPRPRGRCDYAIVAPLDDVGPDYAPAPAEVACVQRLYAGGSIVASACLGAFTLAAAGLLDGRPATTHWAWKGVLASRYPAVDWQVGRMVCDLGDAITAGGYLAAIDLALHIVAATSTRAVAHRIGETLLADSIRQKQSVYAHALIDLPNEHPRFADLVRWIERHLGRPLAVREMAQRCRMSMRSFHRAFHGAFGVTPRKFVQVRRVERVRTLLRDTSRSIEQALLAVGVNDATSFRRVFQRELGCTPAEYRRRLRNEGVTAVQRRRARSGSLRASARALR